MKRILFLILLSQQMAAQQLIVEHQDAMYPLYSRVDSNTIIRIRNLKANMEAKEKMLRDYLAPICDSGDALACYLLAVTYDKFEMGQGNAADAKIALKYYTRAAEGRLADANLFLHKLYRYNFMNQPNDDGKSLFYLREAIRYGGADIRARAYRDMAGIFYQRTGEEPEMKDVTPNRDSVKYYLSRSLALEPGDTWTLDFIGSLYEDEKEYKKAAGYYLQSTNENSTLKVANWLATGRKLPRDTAKALSITWKVLDEYKARYGTNKQKMMEDMGSYNPLVMLNIFSECYGILSKKQLGEWDINSISCDDYEWITSN